MLSYVILSYQCANQPPLHSHQLRPSLSSQRRHLIYIFRKKQICGITWIHSVYYTLQCVYIHIRPENQQPENKQKPENVKEACGQIGVIWTHTVSPYVSLTSKIATAYIYISSFYSNKYFCINNKKHICKKNYMIRASVFVSANKSIEKNDQQIFTQKVFLARYCSFLH